MATFPSTQRILWPDGDEMPLSVVARSAVERGIAKQRRTQSDTVISKTIALLFESVQEVQDFEDWFYSPAGADAGAAWFDFTLPRTGVVVQARVVGGELGALQMMAHQRAYRRSLPLEWKRVLT